MKTKKVPFRETQRFSQWWVWMILIGTGTLPYLPYLTGAYAGSAAGGLIGASLIMLIISLMLLIIRMETILDEDGIYVRFFPFHLKPKFYSWESIKAMDVREYSALREYGGWGIRGFSRQNRAYNVKGNKGLQLEFAKGDRLLIGTSKAEELKKWIDE